MIFRVPVVSLCLLGTLTVSLQAQNRTPNPEAAAVRRVVQSVAEFIQTKNLSGADTLFATGGLHIIEGNGVDHGWAQYRDGHLKPELEQFQNLQYTYSAVEPVVRGNVAWAAFRYALSADSPGGRIEVEGRGTAVLEKQDGRWVIVHFHTAGQRKAPGGTI